MLIHTKILKVSVGSVSQYKLEIVVYDFDQYSVDECIGCCWLSLNRVDIPCDPAIKAIFWVEIMPTDNNEEVYYANFLLLCKYTFQLHTCITYTLPTYTFLGQCRRHIVFHFVPV